MGQINKWEAKISPMPKIHSPNSSVLCSLARRIEAPIL